MCIAQYQNKIDSLSNLARKYFLNSIWDIHCIMFILYNYYYYLNQMYSQEKRLLQNKSVRVKSVFIV